MAGIHLTLDTRGLDQLQARIHGLAGMDTTTLMPRLGEYLQASTKKRFRTETAPAAASQWCTFVVADATGGPLGPVMTGAQLMVAVQSWVLHQMLKRDAPAPAEGGA